MKKNILFYSDCGFFAGCENMLANFFNDNCFTETYNVLFIYRWTQEYQEGFHKRVFNSINQIPLKLYDHYDLYDSVDKIHYKYINKILKIAINILLLKYIFLFFNMIILYKTIRKLDVEILHINNGGYPGAYSTISMVLAAKLYGLKHIVYVVNNIAEDYRSPERWLDYIFDRMVICIVSVFVTGSNFAGSALKDNLHIPSKKILSIPNGISPRVITETPKQVIKRLNLPLDRMIISVIAVLDERKGHIFLLKALSEIKKSHPQNMPYCIFEGTGSEEDFLRKYALEQNLNEDIMFIRNEPQIFNLINASDCIILPSIRNEDFPNIILESMLLGKAIIASNISGIPEQLDQMKSGIIVEPRDIQGLANAIRLFIEEPEFRASLGENAKIKYGTFFTHKRSICKYCDVYDSFN
ncbi:glycosyltransferase family 4 protein [Methanoplanus endosymbiosus]|uniref:Glycosyltransferase family 4 protein n=1 Tax=Methanoplanus endosymbiosus TaxID=33865 RepID=A0A9E7PMG4_9EURY|nr:glycosyltransferase family 4 protein [Methanoplanus endosymbiosus]UUX91659.1 glycosyltransferase family 4 protein [Methanoplanus endosymbiosus]